jgi:dTDP-4-amino-4,6-dideoxygalactose transaminase
MLKKIKLITKKRISNAKFLDKHLTKFDFIKILKRKNYLKEVFHLYCIRIKKNRNLIIKEMKKYLVDVKIHYPVPMHLQPAAKYLRYKLGDFPNTEKASRETLSIPVHEFILKKDLVNIVKIFEKFK